MNGKQLKNSILQWAIQGKLVPQDPNDEPASVLLERIREEKKRLIKEGKIKKDKNESFIFKGDDNSYYEKFADGKVVCIDEEIPFEIPAGWEWARFGQVSFNRDSERIPLSVSERNGLKKVYDYYGASGVIDKVDRYIFDEDLLLIGEDGANLVNRSTPIAYIASGKYWVNNHAHVIDCRGLLSIKYLELFINAISLVPYVTGTAQPKMNQEKMNSILVAVPPKIEQNRISCRVGIILPLIDKYQSAQVKLNTLTQTIYESLRKSILNEAIQGKLVAQNPADEPASVILDRINAEKQRLVKEGRLKAKDVVSSVIFKGEDNKYYEKVGTNIACLDEVDLSEIPENWAYTRLGSLITLLSGRDLEPSQYNACEMGIPYITGASNINCGIQVNRWTTSPVTVSNAGDLLITCKGTVGTMAFNNIGDIHIARQIMAIRSTSLNMQYLQYYLESQLTSLRKQAHSMIPGISREDILSLIIPLPPIQEQQRIVDKVKSLYEKVG